MKHLNLFLLVAAYLVPLALGIQLMLDKRKSISRSIMAFTLLTNFFVNFFNYLYFVEDYALYLPVHGVHAAIEFLIFPSIFIYIKSIVSPHFQLIKEWIHFLPALIMLGLAHYIFYVYTGKKDLLFFMEHNREGYQFVGFQFTVLKVSRFVHLGLLGLQGVLYAIAFLKIPEEYDHKLKNEFSNIDNFSIQWVNNYLLTFALIVVLGFLSYALIPIKGLHQHIVVFVFFVFSAYVSRLGILALRQKEIDYTIDLEVYVPEAVAQNEIALVNDKKLIQKLNNHVAKKQAFLNPDLNLTTLAKDLGTNRTYLSVLINQQFGMNFNAYINSLRAGYAKHYLEENPQTKKEELCVIAGFGSVSTMQRAMSAKI